MKILYVILEKDLRFDEVAVYAELLPAYRREKIERKRIEKDKLRSLIAGLLIRQAIGDSPIRFGEHDKPYVADNSLHFSVSHSGSIVAIAIDKNEIGLDVEELPRAERLKVVDRFYHRNERKYVQKAEDKPRAFCGIWTRKEAYLKMTGEGIGTDLTAFDTTSPPLSDMLYTVNLDGCCLSLCSENQINVNDIYISKLELNELIADERDAFISKLELNELIADERDTFISK